MLEIDYEGIAIAGARSFARAPMPEEIEQMLNDDQGDVEMYTRLNANSTPHAGRIDYLRSVTLSVTRPSEGDVVISRELAREVLTALDNAAGFGAFIPRRIANNAVAEYAGSVKSDCEDAAQRLRRAANLQGAGA